MIFELDGLDKRATSEYCWVDKVSGVGFINPGNVIEISNGFSFDGVNGATHILQGNHKFPPGYETYDQTNATIEIVMYPRLTKSWCPIFMLGDYYENNCTGVATTLTNSDRNRIQYSVKSYTGSLHTYNAFNNKLYTCSTTFNSPIYINKSIMSMYSNRTYMTSNEITMAVGGRLNSSDSNCTSFQGDIYEIRLYNRILTEDEVFHNQTIDIQRYNIEI